MLDKKNTFLKKVNLLLISLEALNIHFNTNKEIREFNEIRKYLRKDYFLCTYKFIDIIQYIYLIKLIATKYLLDEIATEVLKKHSAFNKLKLTTKYNRRFYDITINKQTNIEITQCKAIINLYIISQLTKKQGVYFLIKYLLTK
uniref:Uncharacterized protein n=1 Tax=Polysiphonia sp. TaxID=1967842 RepID=A0A1Z1MUD7_9FLOR|nr:hypothetical protein [Polysiphonia sp.]